MKGLSSRLLRLLLSPLIPFKLYKSSYEVEENCVRNGALWPDKLILLLFDQ